MATQRRLYESILRDHLEQHRQMFLIVVELKYVDADCFSRTVPTVVPARTFLSQIP